MDNTAIDNKVTDIYSLHNVENYKHSLQYDISEIITQYNLLVFEYLKFISENSSLHICLNLSADLTGNGAKNTIYNKFIIIRGFETISHVFNNILYYTKNMDLAFYYGQKAYYFYVEFIGQITDAQNTFLQLNSRDAIMFVYKKTLFEMNNEYAKLNTSSSSTLNNDVFDILQTHSIIIKNIVSFFIHQIDLSNEKKRFIDVLLKHMDLVMKNIETCIHKFSFMGSNNLSTSGSSINKHILVKTVEKMYDILLIFIEKINTMDSHTIYFEVIELFLKKIIIMKNKIYEIKILENIYSHEFNKKIKDTPKDFVDWIIGVKCQ